MKEIDINKMQDLRKEGIKALSPNDLNAVTGGLVGQDPSDSPHCPHCGGIIPYGTICPICAIITTK